MKLESLHEPRRRLVRVTYRGKQSIFFSAIGVQFTPNMTTVMTEEAAAEFRRHLTTDEDLEVK